MARRQIHLFATRGDLAEVVTAVESAWRLAYVRTGLFDDPAVDVFGSLLEVPDLGAAPHGDAAQCPAYLAAARPFVPAVRSVAQRRGGTKHAVDQLENPQTVVIRPGGVLGNRIVIAGSVETGSANTASLELFAAFGAEIRSRFSRIKSYRVGVGAAAILDAGGRLTASIKSPPLYDLSRD